MAKKWYPVVDVLSCIECGTCVGFCRNGVYDKNKTPSPIVVNPNGCIEKCRKCGEMCPVNAISYVGDTNNSNTTSDCGCGCTTTGGACCG